MDDNQAIREYARKINAKLTGGATEQTHRLAFEEFTNHLAGGEYAYNEGQTDESTIPDFVIRTNAADIGHIECKNVPIDLGPIEEDSEKSVPSTDNGKQLKRYRVRYQNLLLTNYHEFRWFKNGARRGDNVRLLDWNGEKKVRLHAGGTDDAIELFRDFLTTGPQPVNDAKELAEKLARLTRQLRDAIERLFEHHEASLFLENTKDTFERTLIPDLQARQFADMYAQTLAYGLFVARVNHSGQRKFDRLSASGEIPRAIPFLRQVFDSLVRVEINDEPYVDIIDDISEVLCSADMASVLQDFGRSTATEDPVQHFYETFLNEYDSNIRVSRGVYYTPEPVVSYIVRSVDYILRHSFACEDGLADTSKIEYSMKDLGESEIESIENLVHRVLILDPACGTGTFLASVVELVRNRVMQRGDLGMWHGYVREELLPRLFGFELMMAPYTVAHFNLWMRLQAQQTMFNSEDPVWGDADPIEDRIGVYLTNTLEPAPTVAQTNLDWFHNSILAETSQASKVKDKLPIMVIIGNPPYSGESANEGKWINELMHGRDDGKPVADYFSVDGLPLNESNTKWINDDYIKFIRFGHWRIERSGQGILAFITNHGWIDNTTFHGIRESLLRDFDEIYILDLHGSRRKNEKDLQGRPDGNVFDIDQGVAINLFIKYSDDRKSLDGRATVHHAELYGDRNSKYLYLSENDVSSTEWQFVDPRSPSYLFVPRSMEFAEEYENSWSIRDIFVFGQTGMTAGLAEMVIGFTQEEMLRTLQEFVAMIPNEARVQFSFDPRTSTSRIEKAQTDIAAYGVGDDQMLDVLFRPFDKRVSYWTPTSDGAWSRPRPELTPKMKTGQNLGLIGTRGIEVESGFNHVHCTDAPIVLHSLTNKEGNYLFPLYVETELESGSGVDKVSNLSPGFNSAMETALNLRHVKHRNRGLSIEFDPEDAFDYIYALLHSSTYRHRFDEFLRYEFPRIPITCNKDLFKEMVMLGNELRRFHLMQIEPRENIPNFPVHGDHKVTDVRFTPRDGLGRLWINDSQYFEGVSEAIWDLKTGSYNTIREWLDNRKDRILTNDEINHFKRMCGVLVESIRLVEEIDDCIERHGGWPVR